MEKDTNYKAKRIKISFVIVGCNISNDKFIWNLGDGTVIKGISAEHIYNIPGVYNVSVVGYDSDGVEYLSTQTQQVSVSDFFDNKLIHDSTHNVTMMLVNAQKTLKGPFT